MRRLKMSKGLVEITISVDMEFDDEGYLSGEQEKQLDDVAVILLIWLPRMVLK